MAEASPQSPRAADPCVMLICGASGDLTRRKLIPALYNLAKLKLLSHDFAIIGFARNDLTTDQFRQQLSQDIKKFATSSVEPEIWDWFLKRIYYLSGDFTDPKAYEKLKELLAQASKSHSTRGNYFYYLAVAPTFFGEIVRQLDAAGLVREDNGQWRRVIIEKPFGRNLESARSLNAEIKHVLHEKQIYRIDHYLGKETVQNILVFRFGNGIFEPIWNRQYIDHIQITAAETVGVEQRGGYYETSGALRDMVPNHLFQLRWSRLSRLRLTPCAMSKRSFCAPSNRRHRKRSSGERCAANIAMGHSAASACQGIDRNRTSRRSQAQRPLSR